jgi:hypothetical protein
VKKTWNDRVHYEISSFVKEVIMSDVNWQIEGLALANCNCAWGCPCQFNSLPTSGQCEAVWAMRIDEGHFNGTRLDGLTWGTLLWWPGAVHEGNGKQQLFYEERASAEQRSAIEAIGRGKVSAEGTYFHIFASVAPDFYPSIAAPSIEFDCDVDARKGRLRVPGLIEADLTPIRNPVTDAEHRAHVVFPKGFEYREAEYASGVAATGDSAAIALNLDGSHAHLYRAGWNESGVVAD